MDKKWIVEQVMNHLENSGEQSEQSTSKESPVESGKNFSIYNLVEGAGYEFIGTAIGDTIGIVIPSLDAKLHERFGFDPKYRSLGIISARSGGGPHGIGIDEAIKSCNCELLLAEMPRDTKGGGGHGVLIIVGAEDVSDVRQAVEIALRSMEWATGDQYMNEVGYCEIQFSARAGKVLEKMFMAEYGKAWGLLCGCPAAVGLAMADRAMKAADIKILQHCTPNLNTSHTNEVIMFFSGDAGAVKQACIVAKETGRNVLEKMGSKTVSSGGTPYIY